MRRCREHRSYCNTLRGDSLTNIEEVLGLDTGFIDYTALLTIPVASRQLSIAMCSL